MLVSLPLSMTFDNAFVPTLLGAGSSVSCGNIWRYANGYSPVSGAQYQWFLNNAPIAGATVIGLNITQTGVYSVSITKGACTGLSKPVLIQPYTLAKPLLANTASLINCSGSAVRLAPVSNDLVRWKRNGAFVPSLFAGYFYAMESGTYSFQTISGPCSAESDPVEIRIGEPTAATLTGNALVNAGQAVQLPVQFNGPAPWSFTLNNGQTVQNTYLNPYPLLVTATATSSYSIVGVENTCGTGTAVGQVTITVGSGQADVSLAAQVSSRTPRVNDIITYSLLLTNAGP